MGLGLVRYWGIVGAWYPCIWQLHRWLVHCVTALFAVLICFRAASGCIELSLSCEYLPRSNPYLLCWTLDVSCVYCINVLHFIRYLGELSDWIGFDCNSVGHIPCSEVWCRYILTSLQYWSNISHMSVNNLSNLKSQYPNNSSVSIHSLEDDSELCRLMSTHQPSLYRFPTLPCLLHSCLQ